MNTEYFFLLSRTALAATVYPINQNLFSINFFCCSLSFSWLTEFVYFSMGKALFCMLCARFGLAGSGFLIYYYNFIVWQEGMWGVRRGMRSERHRMFPMTLERVLLHPIPIPDWAASRDVAEAGEVWWRTHFLQSQQNRSVQNRGEILCVLAMNHTPSLNNEQRKKRGIIDSDENLLALTSEENFHFFHSRISARTFNGTRYFILITVGDFILRSATRMKETFVPIHLSFFVRTDH